GKESAARPGREVDGHHRVPRRRRLPRSIAAWPGDVGGAHDEAPARGVGDGVGDPRPVGDDGEDVVAGTRGAGRGDDRQRRNQARLHARTGPGPPGPTSFASPPVPPTIPDVTRVPHASGAIRAEYHVRPRRATTCVRSPTSPTARTPSQPSARSRAA